MSSDFDFNWREIPIDNSEPRPGDVAYRIRKMTPAEELKKILEVANDTGSISSADLSRAVELASKLQMDEWRWRWHICNPEASDEEM